MKLGEIFPPTAAMWLKVSKGIAGGRSYELDPPMRRDLTHRRSAEHEIASIAALVWFARWQSVDEIRTTLLSEAAAAAASEANNMDEAELSALEAFAASLAPLADGSEVVAGASPVAVSKRAGRVREALLELLDGERVKFPDAPGSELAGEVPRFLDFAERFRSLKSSYNLDDETDFNDAAMRSVAAAAGLSPKALRDAIRSAQAGTVKTMLDKAGEDFTRFLRENWRQSSLAVIFENQGSTLRIFVRADSADVFLLDERSDGLRIFLALVSFVAARRTGVDPILLIDEAETHLHYDAQADLARLLELQTNAASVVYTTHSIGCLPQDLGRGVRAVKPIPEADRSVTLNAWWNAGGGLTPLVVAMGAQAFGFTPARFAVFAEGPSDALLLPTLIREATGLRSLPYQIVPGISSASLDRLEVMTTETPRVAFIVDGDLGGAAISKRLRDAGIPAEQIVGLGRRPRAGGLQVEDLLDPDVYAAAVNEELRSWGPGTGTLRGADLPKTRRPQFVDRYCATIKRSSVGKLAVAEEVLKLLEGSATNTPARTVIGDVSYRDRLLTIHAALINSLGIPS